MRVTGSEARTSRSAVGNVPSSAAGPPASARRPRKRHRLLAQENLDDDPAAARLIHRIAGPCPARPPRRRRRDDLRRLRLRPCTPAGDGVRECSAEVASFDGTPIDVNVAFPPEPAWATDGNYPLIMVFHGWGGSKASFNALRWVDQPRVCRLSMTDRGFGASCGEPLDVLDPACANGHIHLMDTRWEVRDAQEFAGRLANQGLIDPQRIGSTGGSYGGGISMALAALRNRKMLRRRVTRPLDQPDRHPDADRRRRPRDPLDRPRLLARPQRRPPSTTSPRTPTAAPPGVLKQSFVAGLYAARLGSGPLRAAPASTRRRPPHVVRPHERRQALEGDPIVADMIDELTTHHSSYYIDDSIAPAPLLISNGWTDDLFPADEAIRFYNRTRARHPSSPISLFFLDYGHQRGTGRAADVNRLRAQQDAWFDHFVRGDGPPPSSASPLSPRPAPRRPFRRPLPGRRLGQIAPGEVRLTPQRVEDHRPRSRRPRGRPGLRPDRRRRQRLCIPAAADQSGTATYRLDPAPAAGYTLLGSPTITAAIDSTSPTSQIAARLLDVAPDGHPDPRRPRPSTAPASTRSTAAARSSSSTPTAGTSPPATFPSSSSSAPTLPMPGHPTARAPSPSPTSTSGCPSASAPAPAAASSSSPRPSPSPTRAPSPPASAARRSPPPRQIRPRPPRPHPHPSPLPRPQRRLHRIDRRANGFRKGCAATLGSHRPPPRLHRVPEQGKGPPPQAHQGRAQALPQPAPRPREDQPPQRGRPRHRNPHRHPP